MSGPPRRMSREDRRESLLDTAASLIDAQGAGHLSFESLAEAAGVAKSLPYVYFESKDEILVTLFDRVIGQLDSEVEAVVAEGGEFETIVQRSLDVWFDAVRDHGRLVGGLLDGRSVPGLAPSIRRRDRMSHKLWHDLVIERFGLEGTEAHLLAAMLNTTATAAVELWVTRKGSRAALVSSFVAMACGAAASLQAVTSSSA